MKKMMMITGALTVGIIAPVLAKDPVLKSHTAVYAMTHVPSYDQHWSPVQQADGVLRYKFQQGCKDWSVEHHSAMHLMYENNQQAQLTWSYASIEQKSGKKLTFRSQTKRNGVMGDVFKGEARRQDGKTVIIYATPNGRREEMSLNTLFPTQHLLETLRQGRAGETVFSRPYFDGSGEQAAYQLDTVVTPYKGRKVHKVNDIALDPLAVWSINLSFYEEGSQNTISDMAVSARYREDGIATHLVQDYGDFALEGKLIELEIHDDPVCD